VSALAAISCGDSPTAPAPPLLTPRITLGRQTLFLVVNAVVPNPLTPRCEPADKFANASLYGFVTVTQEGVDWVVRPADPTFGNLELRFHTATAPDHQPAVEGTVSGFISDFPSSFTQPPGSPPLIVNIKVTLDGTATVTGEQPPSPTPGIFGTFTGTTFHVAHPDGSSCTTTGITWLLMTGPPPPVIVP